VLRVRALACLGSVGGKNYRAAPKQPVVEIHHGLLKLVNRHFPFQLQHQGVRVDQQPLGFEG